MSSNEGAGPRTPQQPAAEAGCFVVAPGPPSAASLDARPVGYVPALQAIPGNGQWPGRGWPRSPGASARARMNGTVEALLTDTLRELEARRRHPESTYRLQFHAGFTFRDAE